MGELDEYTDKESYRLSNIMYDNPHAAADELRDQLQQLDPQTASDLITKTKNNEYAGGLGDLQIQVEFDQNGRDSGYRNVTMATPDGIEQIAELQSQPPSYYSTLGDGYSPDPMGFAAGVIVGDLLWQQRRGIDFDDDRYRGWSNREMWRERDWNEHRDEFVQNWQNQDYRNQWQRQPWQQNAYNNNQNTYINNTRIDTTVVNNHVNNTIINNVINNTHNTTINNSTRNNWNNPSTTIIQGGGNDNRATVPGAWRMPQQQTSPFAPAPRPAENPTVKVDRTPPSNWQLPQHREVLPQQNAQVPARPELHREFVPPQQNQQLPAHPEPHREVVPSQQNQQTPASPESHRERVQPQSQQPPHRDVVPPPQPQVHPEAPPPQPQKHK